MGGGSSVPSFHNALDESFFGGCIPEDKWKAFCELWKCEPKDASSLCLTNRLAFIVVAGKVNAQLSTPPDPWITAKTFEKGEIIHLFTAAEKLANEKAFVTFDKMKLAFMPEKGSIVYGLDETLYKAFIKENASLISLGHLMKLKFYSLVQSNIYFEGIPEAKIDMLGPLLSLKRAAVNDILFRNIYEGARGHKTGIIIAGKCVALHDDVNIDQFRAQLAEHNSQAAPPAADAPPPPVNPKAARRSSMKRSVYQAELDAGTAGENGPPTLAKRMSIRLMTSPLADANAANQKEFPIDDKGELLRKGAIYGFEQAVLPSHVGMKDVVALSSTIYAELHPSIFDCLRKIDPKMESAMIRNFSFNILDSVKEIVPAIAELDVTATMALAGYTKFEYFNTGVTIFKPGTNLTKMYIILQGKTKETIPAGAGTGAEESVEYFPGDSFGEVCMISATPYTTTMVAQASTVLLSFDEKAYESTFYNDKAKLAEMKLRVKGSDYELSSVLYYPPALELFEAFSVKEHATESLYLWKAIDRLEELCQRIDRQLENAMNGSVRAQSVSRATTMSRGLKTTSSLRKSSVTPDEAIPGQASKKPVYVKAEPPEKIYEAGITQIRDVIKNILDQYIVDGSPNQVNIPGKMRVQLEEEVKQWLQDTAPAQPVPKYDHCNPNLSVPKDIFAKVKTEAYMVMRKDTFARWRFTAEFTQFIDKLEPFSRRRSSLQEIPSVDGRRASTDFSNSMLRKQSMRMGESVDKKRLKEIEEVHVNA